MPEAAVADPVLLKREGAVALIIMNRPEKMNAVNGDVMGALRSFSEEVSKDASVQAVVLCGEGRAFCAGADLSGAGDRAAPTNLGDRFPIREDTGWPVTWFGVNIPKPVVCAIQGPAVGWGAEALASCDMRVAGESARIGWVFAKRGLITDLGVGPLTLPRLVGQSQALRLLFSGEIVNAAEALRIGLVDEVVPDDRLRARAVELAAHLAEGAPACIRIMKEQVWSGIKRHPMELYYDNLVEFQKNMASEDFKEGVKSFLEKRPAVWTGR